jgi:hypothetical protein
MTGDEATRRLPRGSSPGVGSGIIAEMAEARDYART